jgi:hypothetical protein
VKKQSDLLERARIEKKLADLIKKKGILNLKNLKDIETIVKEEKNLKPFDCSIEVKTNKDTFTSNKYEKPVLTTKATLSPKKRPKKHSSSPIPMLSINIEMGGKVEKIHIYPQDDPLVVAENFCTHHSNILYNSRYPRRTA